MLVRSSLAACAAALLAIPAGLAHVASRAGPAPATPAALELRVAGQAGTHVLSEPVHLEPAAPVQQVVAAGGEYSVDGRAFTVLPGLAYPGARIVVRVPAAREGEVPAKATLVIGRQRWKFAAQ